MNRWLALSLAAMVAVPALALAQDKPAAAADEKAQKAAADKVMLKQMPMEDITVSGKVAKDDKGKLVLKTDDGAPVVLPKGDLEFEKYLGKSVTVVGRGFSHMKTTPSGEKTKKVHIRSVTSVSEAGAAAPAPKADAPATNAPAAAPSK